MAINDYFVQFRAVLGQRSLELHPPEQREGRLNTEKNLIDYDGLNTPAGTNLPQGYETGRSVDVVVPARDRYREKNTYPFREFQALGVVSAYVLLRQAQPAFPGSTRSGPSRVVVVTRKVHDAPLFRPGDTSLFPMRFNWRVWHQGVVPVLKQDISNPQLPVNAGTLQVGDFDRYAFLLERLLVESFQQQGFLPS